MIMSYHYRFKTTGCDKHINVGFEVNARGNADSNHYRKPGLCPVLKSLPSAKYRALGKGHLCRVPHSAKLGTRQIGLCRVSGTRQNTALGKAKLCPVPDTRQSWALGKVAPGITVPDAGLFAECLLFGTRQNIGFAECLGLALGKIFTLPSAKPWHSAK